MNQICLRHEFEVRWYREIRNELNRVCSFYNKLAERLGGEKIHIFT
ncbi:MAG: hypothetical protein KKA10_16290 [Euryarchaeota archaeon]|nr:hypothetical protein [Euryarchaeota archaeon]MCG2735652.1 hypothetical protein [Candidatus Methanoperedenaceae archaeon]